MVIASEGIRHKMFEVCLADLQNDKGQSYRKMRLMVTNFTTYKLRYLVRKWQTLIEAYIDVKTTYNFTLRMFCIGFTQRRKNQAKHKRLSYT
ncbi:hypothetical protein MKX01_025565 [Papaver californicum]|nr:hypothetical protein MKX01_025565 [Papaver californicum]